MPPFGLGKVAESTSGGRLVEAKGKYANAAGRLGLDGGGLAVSGQGHPDANNMSNPSSAL